MPEPLARLFESPTPSVWARLLLLFSVTSFCYWVRRGWAERKRRHQSYADLPAAW